MKECNNITDEDIKIFNKPDLSELFCDLRPFLFSGVVEDNSIKEHIEKMFEQSDDSKKEMVKPIIDQAYDKIKDLAKTMKKIRELS